MGDNSNIGTSTRKPDSSGSKNTQTDLTKEIPNLIVAQDVTAVNAAAIKSEDEMLGTLLDMKA